MTEHRRRMSRPAIIPSRLVAPPNYPRACGGRPRNRNGHPPAPPADSLDDLR